MIEVQVDTLVGPTHYYGGLSYGNVASMQSRLQPANPRLAALQGLEKMKLVHELGAPQLILPPQPRPLFTMLEALGFTGTKQQCIEKAFKEAPDLLIECSSQSAMWTANAATVTPSADSLNGKVHFTAANLSSHLHRSLETCYTQEILQQVFSNKRYFTHHCPLPSCQEFADEGAANHTRLVVNDKAIHLFVYGRTSITKTHLFPARQTLLAQEAIARSHLLNPAFTIFAQQNPKVIDQGVFHNDVIAVGHNDLFFFHEEAYTNTQAVIEQISKLGPFTQVRVQKKELSVEAAVKSYIFNSQFLTLPGGETVVICPSEVQAHPQARAIVEGRLPVDRIYYLCLNQSMKNGGGPACLRLRVPLTSRELAAIDPGFIFTHTLYEKLKKIITNYYPESYTPQNLLDPSFRKQCNNAIQKIRKTLGLQPV